MFNLPLKYSLFLAALFALLLPTPTTGADQLPGTSPLDTSTDIASNLVAGVDKFLLGKWDESVKKRAQFWAEGSLETNRSRLAHILGVRDHRASNSTPHLLEFVGSSALLATGSTYKVYEVQWSAFGEVTGIGLMAVPDHGKPIAQVIAVPDSSVTPEQLFGLKPGTSLPYAQWLAESGCLVISPVVIDRVLHKHRNSTLSNREFLYRPAFILGRHLIGYEIQKVLALVDGFKKSGYQVPTSVVGWGEGGLLAFHAAALDPRIDSVLVSGYFGNQRTLWDQPLDRNVFGLLEKFGNAEVARLISPRRLVIDTTPGPELVIPAGQGGAPSTLKGPSSSEAKAELERVTLTNARLNSDGLQTLLRQLFPGEIKPSSPPVPVRAFRSEIDRMNEQIAEIDRHNQKLLALSAGVRAEFMKKLDYSSIEKFERSADWYRNSFYEEVVGKFPDPLLPFNARSKKSYSGNGWTGYEVVLDVFPDVIAYGVLLLPNNITPGEKRPVVVCQHGLEGRPQDIIQGDNPAYHDFAAKLAERGFITFSPQNLYIFKDRFRTLQRKANPLKKTLFSIITPQHQQIVNWLKILPQVDSSRIGFYGLSYGGKTAMRVPALVTDYAFSICSADFNEWVWKNASTISPFSYVWTGEYEIFEWDLGSTFNYAEMAALIAPRPFMVERGHFDGVAPDEMVAHEYAKIRNLYAAKLKIGDRTEIEWFVGPHTINGKGTFDFCHKHLAWPPPGK